MTLREELIVRLTAVGNEADKSDDFRWNSARAVPAIADECIRQMEWVAYKTAHSHRSSEGYDDEKDALAASKDYVTLAPPEWKP